MKFELKIVGNQAQTINKPERQADGSVKQNAEQMSRIVARDDKGNTFACSMPYNEGKTFDLDRVLSVTVE